MRLIEALAVALEYFNEKKEKKRICTCKVLVRRKSLAHNKKKKNKIYCYKTKNNSNFAVRIYWLLLFYSVRVMAFLRSVTRCNQSLAVSRKFSTSIGSGVQQRRGHGLASLNNITFTRTELLACQKYYLDLRRELNTTKNADNEQRASLATLAATNAPSTTNTSVQNSNDPKPQRDPLDVSFNDPIAAFKSKTTWELIRAYFVYIMCSSGYLVENNAKVMRALTAKIHQMITLSHSPCRCHFILYWFIRRVLQRL